MGEEVKEKKPNKYVEGFKGFCTFLYNPDDHTVFGRGGASWGKILIFYFFFYSCLAAFFAVCLMVMLTTIDPKVPTVVGRTNKPMVAAFDTRLYTIDFKDNVQFLKYKEGVQDLTDLYKGDKQVNETKWFQWNTENLGSVCVDSAYSTNSPTDMKACIYVGLNRIYNWSPPTDETSTLSFECSWDVGPTGSGNLEPPFDITISDAVRSASEEALGAFYPWTSMEESGLQPIQAFQIKADNEKLEAAKEIKNFKMDTFVVCNAVMRNSTGATPLEGSRPAEFEIKYSLPE